MEDLISRIIKMVHTDLSKKTPLINWEPDYTEQGIEFKSTTREGGRGLVVFKVSDDEYYFGMERESGNGSVCEECSTQYRQIKEIYDTLVTMHFDIEKMDVHELIDFYFRISE